MKPTLLTLATLCLLPLSAQAQDAGAGAALFEEHCAVCHGADARGKGPLAPALLLQPPNLRTLTARHDGTFPMVRVVTRIDGRDPLVSHGSPMPIYGEFFEGDDTPLKAETGQPILTSRLVAEIVAFLQEIQE